MNVALAATPEFCMKCTACTFTCILNIVKTTKIPNYLLYLHYTQNIKYMVFQCVTIFKIYLMDYNLKGLVLYKSVTKNL